MSAMDKPPPRVHWCRAINGDPHAPDDQWYTYSPEWAEEAEGYFQRFLASGGNRFDSRAVIQAASSAYRGRGGGHWFPVEPSSAGFTVDFSLMTCMEPQPKGYKSKVWPLRRYEGGRLQYPTPGMPHPWFSHKHSSDMKDFMNNDFFLRAFLNVLADKGFQDKLKSRPCDIFDFQWNRDYRKQAYYGATTCGGLVYHEPVGWKKFAFKVADKYGDGDNEWFGVGGKPGEWCFAYHGTHHENMPQILPELPEGGGMCTPRVDTAAALSPALDVNGRLVQMVFQIRVRPDAIRDVLLQVGEDDGVWLSVSNPMDDIRPHGVLLREVVADRDVES